MFSPALRAARSAMLIIGSMGSSLVGLGRAIIEQLPQKIC
jgi:hypothetical protein